jgi:hypothetical protein
MNTNKTILLTSTAIVVALALVLAPSVVADNVLATKSNKAFQGIFQGQSSKQNSQVISGDDTKFSGNNFNFQKQFNKGNNALGQFNN